VRLLAPRAELRVQIAGGSSMIDSGRLSYLGEALRALLVLEVRPDLRVLCVWGGGRGGRHVWFCWHIVYPHHTNRCWYTCL
jgi:hypothetical protein